MSWKTDTRFLLAWAACVVCAVASAAVAPGQPFPRVSRLPLPPPPPSGAAAPGRVLVVDFWASWCAPCKASFPAYSALQTELGPRGLCVVGVSVDQDDAAYRSFVGRLNPSFTTVRDAGQQLVSRVAPAAMPTSYVIDRRGIVRFVHAGFHPDTAATLRAEILQLLDESP